MNLPNKLTVLRMCMIVVFLLCYFAYPLPYHYLFALAVFAIASITDMLDGKIARKRNLITDFGKLMDPLADKLLTLSAFCCILPEYGMWGTISLILILSREFLVTSIRMIAASKGDVLAADIWGKAKTVAQMVWICLVLLLRAAWQNFSQSLGTAGSAVLGILEIFDYVTVALLAVLVLLTVVSGVHYVIKNRGLFADA